MRTESSKERLDSWKEIAAYLKCDERTAMRWQESGLPVRRAPGRGRGRVFAYVGEIDAWLNSTNTVPISATTLSSATEPRGTSSIASRPLAARLARTPRLVQAGLIAAIGIGFFAMLSLIFKALSVAPLADVVIEDNRFQALDASGRRLWSYPLPAGLPRIPPNVQPRLRYVGDLLGDGHKVVLTSVPLADPPTDQKGNELQVFCFSDAGELLWNFNPKYVLSFGTGDFGPPWEIRQWLIYRIAGKPRVAVVVTHSTWWPSLVVVLDQKGTEISRFVNSGEVFSLAFAESGPRQVLLVGGVSNANGPSGSLAVLDAANPSGSSPEEQSQFRCHACPPGIPLHYFVFPRSEVNVLTLSHFNKVTYIKPTESGFDVRTFEAQPNEQTRADGMFEFNEDFSLKRASWSDGYAEVHRKLERDEVIHHAWERCPDRLGPSLVRSWDPQHGWTEIHPNAKRN